ncbi:MAG: DNA primase [Candidatus Omnitrophota bacterium]
MIPQETIDRIIDALDIVEVISEYAQLKKSGRNFKACCPFHNEKTPSFVVSPEKQIYHCFGCSAGGNAIGFIMQYENLSFPEAVEKAAAKCGIELPKYKRENEQKTSLAGQLYKVNLFASVFYQRCLRDKKGKKALDYLKKRGFTDEIVKKFKIGYAPDEWEGFKKYCETKKVPPMLLKKAGLTIASDKGKGDYDRFRNRIMFPIFNERDSVLGFGGRVMDNSLPKYINSPETLVYTKGNVLYGLNFSKKAIREKGFVIITEGYMDVVIPGQYGIENIVAASGTAITPHQASMIKKYTDTAVMVFDADQAGERASLRGLDILIEEGIKVKIVTLPEGEDPDSFIRKKGPENFEKHLDSAKDLLDYKLDLLIKKFGKRDVGAITGEMLPTISKVKNMVVRSDYLKTMGERLAVDEASLRYEMKKGKKEYSYNDKTAEKNTRVSNPYRKSEVHLLGLALVNKAFYYTIIEELGVEKFRDEDIRKALRAAGEIYDSGKEKVDPGKLIGHFAEREIRDVIAQAVAGTDIAYNETKALKDCIFCVKKENREEELTELSQKLKEAQKNKNTAEIDQLIGRIAEKHKKKVA